MIDNAVLLVRDGLIEAVGPARSTAIPAGYDVRDVGERWLMPGMIDLHCHVGGTFDINDMVFLTQPRAARARLGAARTTRCCSAPSPAA